MHPQAGNEEGDHPSCPPGRFNLSVQLQPNAYAFGASLRNTRDGFSTRSTSKSNIKQQLPLLCLLLLRSNSRHCYRVFTSRSSVLRTVHTSSVEKEAEQKNAGFNATRKEKPKSQKIQKRQQNPLEKRGPIPTRRSPTGQYR